MTIALVPKETLEGESRVAATPDTVKRLVELRFDVRVGGGAGGAAGFSDADYEKAGARIARPEGAAWAEADLVLKVQPPTLDEAARLRRGAVLVSFVIPSQRLDLVERLAERGVTSLAMDLVPRITRAQAMDALSSQATVAGYEAVLLGTIHLRRMCPQLMTAAGTVSPARVLVFGAGVAGLQAIATARRLGCVVEATDVRRAAREQVLSLGARFIDVPGMEDLEGAGGYAREATPEMLERQRIEIGKRLREADLVVTTAVVPGRPAPRLIGAEMVRTMKKGAVIVDMAVESGGNCELSVAGEVVEREGVTLVGLRNLAARIPQTASELYAKNVLNLVKLFVGKDGGLADAYTDEVLAGCLLVHRGEVRHPQTAEALRLQAAAS